MKKGFTEEELESYKRLGLESILKKNVTGFNYYPISIEKTFENIIHIPIKYGHRSAIFLDLLKDLVKKEFKDSISIKIFPRQVSYQWLRGYNFPKSEEQIRIFDVENNRYVNTKEEYVFASNKLLAEGSEQSVSFIPNNTTSLVDIALFLIRKGSFYLTDENGDLIPFDSNSNYPFKLNPERISDDAYMTPMIITSHTTSLVEQLKGFAPVKKLYIIQGNEEISVYLDKTYDNFIEDCIIEFEGPKLKLANKLFRNFINFEGI